MEDRVLKKLVEAELEWEPSIDAADIGMTVEKGIVTLIGHVPTYAQKAVAEAVVKRVKGARGFVDRIEVKPLGLDFDSDEALAARIASVIAWDVTIPKNIEAALERQADLAADKVRVIVDGDKVRLEGSVRAWVERDTIERAALAAPGVRAVDDRIGISL